MQALWDQMQRHLQEPLPVILYLSGWLLLLLIIGDVCFQALPHLGLRKKKTPLKFMAIAGGLVTLAPTRRVHPIPRLFEIGYHLLIVGFLASMGVAVAYRMSLQPLLEVIGLVPLIPLREPAVGLAFLVCGVLIWSGFRVRALRSASLAGFVLLDVCWFFVVAWVSLGKPPEQQTIGSYPEPSLVSWIMAAGESAWRQKPNSSGFLFLGAALFLMGILTVSLGYRRPKGKRRQSLPISYLQASAPKKSRRARVNRSSV